MARTRGNLFGVATTQEGYFTAAQALTEGYSRQLLRHHVHSGKFRRVQRGIYRYVEYPFGDHEQYVVAWLWSDHLGVFSHQTALAHYELSDVLPARIHLTVPESWRRRRLKVPEGIVLHHADVPDTDRDWLGPVPVTRVARTLNDCARNHFSPELLQQGARQALARGLVQLRELDAVRTALEPFGGIGP